LGSLVSLEKEIRELEQRSTTNVTFEGCELLQDGGIAEL
jgi:hypothetical protein